MFLRKLKWQYSEHWAKDQYIKIIKVDNEDEMLTKDDLDELHETNLQRKAIVKEAKNRLAEKYKDIETLAPFVEQGTPITFIHPSRQNQL